MLAGLGDGYEVVALAAGSQVDVLSEQVAGLRPRVVAMADADARSRLVPPAGTELDD